MVEEYFDHFYLPSASAWKKVQENGFQKLRDFVAWIGRVRENWSQIKILAKPTSSRMAIALGDSLQVEVIMDLGRLSPQDLSVNVYYGPVDSKGEFLSHGTIPLLDVTREESKTIFRGTISCREVGRFGFRIRVLPSHPLLVNPYSLGLILWG
jgi:glycogen phosphorylase